jgi:ribosomal 50S subunit-recycling heat shock protein
VNVPGAARVYKLRPATKKLAKGGKAKLKLRVPKPARAAIRNALAHHRKVRAKIVVRVTDKAGNARTTRRTIKLRR